MARQRGVSRGLSRIVDRGASSLVMFTVSVAFQISLNPTTENLLEICSQDTLPLF